MTTLVVAGTQHDVARLVGAARHFGDAVDVLLPLPGAAGAQEAAEARAAAMLQGVRQVWVARHPHLADWLAEPFAAFLAGLVRHHGHARIVGDSGMAGRDVLARLAGLLCAPALTDIVEVTDACTVRRPMHAGDIMATVHIGATPAVLLVRTATFPPADRAAAPAPVRELPVPDDLPAPAAIVGQERPDSGALPDLARARIVLGMGRGAADEHARTLLLRLARRLGAAVGVTRPLVDEGLAPGDWQVGQTGKRIAPQLYIAFGISGAHQHLAGIADAGTIVAVNTDSEAPIFAAADLGLEMDACQVLQELLARLPDGA